MIKLNITDRDGTPVALEAEADLSLMEVMRDAGLSIEAICGGCCSCGTCHVYIDDAWLEVVGPRSEDEHALIEFFDHFDDKFSRLGCQIPVTDKLDGLKLTIAPEE